MSIRIRRVLTFLAFVAVAFGQKGSAPPGFYPSNYHGDIFTGTVSGSDGDQLTLVYEKGKKRETFVGRIERPCIAPTKAGKAKELRLAAIPQGTILTVFYNHERAKEGALEKDSYTIVGIRFDRLNGQELTDPGRPVIPCSAPVAGLNVH
jgi:hypothetical protein